jgi:hypothetical protein
MLSEHSELAGVAWPSDSYATKRNSPKMAQAMEIDSSETCRLRETECQSEGFMPLLQRKVEGISGGLARCLS